MKRGTVARSSAAFGTAPPAGIVILGAGARYLPTRGRIAQFWTVGGGCHTGTSNSVSRRPRQSNLFLGMFSRPWAETPNAVGPQAQTLCAASHPDTHTGSVVKPSKKKFFKKSFFFY